MSRKRLVNRWSRASQVFERGKHSKTKCGSVTGIVSMFSSKQVCRLESIHACCVTQRQARASAMEFACIVFMAGSLLCAQPPGTQEGLNAETALINFDELLAKEMAAAAFKPTFLAKRFAFDTYREKHGLLLGTTQLIGQPLVVAPFNSPIPLPHLAYFAVTRNPSFHAPASWSRRWWHLRPSAHI